MPLTHHTLFTDSHLMHSFIHSSTDCFQQARCVAESMGGEVTHQSLSRSLEGLSRPMSVNVRSDAVGRLSSIIQHTARTADRDMTREVLELKIHRTSTSLYTHSPIASKAMKLRAEIIHQRHNPKSRGMK